jgi:hypothetical protein
MMRAGSILAVVAILLTACSGGGLPSGSVVNSPGNGSNPPPAKLVNVKVTITIPAATKTHGIRSDYVSVNTQSVVIQLSSVNGNGVTGVNPTIVNTVAHAHGCSQNANGTVCTATTLGSPGQDVFAVTTYASTNANGAVLSVGTVQAKINGGGSNVAINRLSLTLDGVIAGLKLSLAPASAKRGEPAEAKVTLAAFDATGAQIVGPSDYSTPIVLAIQGDGDNAFHLKAEKRSSSSLTIAKPTSNIVLSYDGNKQASSITVAATVDGPGSFGANAGFALHGKQPPPPVGTIYALNLGANDGQAATVTEYDGKASGNAAPERTLTLDSKLYARSIVVDSQGNLYVGYFDSEFGFSPSDGVPDKGNEIAIYAAGASGNDQPSAVLTADKSKGAQTEIFPLFMSFDPSGDLVTYGATAIDGIGGNDAVLTYAPDSSGPAAPISAWAFASPTLIYAGPTGLALDSSGNFYVNGALHSTLGPSYGLNTALASDNGDPSVAPARTIPWDSTTELTPGLTTNVALSTSGEIFIANTTTQGSASHTSCQGHANVYSAGPSGGITDVPPVRVLTLVGISTTNSECASARYPLSPFFPTITLYGTSLFAVDDFNNAISAYNADASGMVKPRLQIAGSSTQLDAPIAIVVTSQDSGQVKAGSVHP